MPLAGHMTSLAKCFRSGYRMLYQLFANFTRNKVLKSRQFSQINMFLRWLLSDEDCSKSAHLLIVKRLIVQPMSSGEQEIVKLCFPAILFGAFYLSRATVLDSMKSCLKYLPLENLFYFMQQQHKSVIIPVI